MGYIETGNRPFCKNSVVNALPEQNIDCFFSISIDGFTKLDDITLCSVFANTLDNAIEACSRIPTPTAWESPQFRKL